MAVHARRVVARAGREGAHEREGVQVDAHRPQPGRANGLDEALDHRLAGGDDDDVRARVAVGVDAVADPVEVEHDLVERHRDRLGGLEANRGLEVLALVDAGQLELADDDLLVRDAEAHVAAAARRRGRSP